MVLSNQIAVPASTKNNLNHAPIKWPSLSNVEMTNKILFFKTCVHSSHRDVVTGKTRKLVKTEMNERLKSLFKKVKRAVNAVGGNNLCKKYLWIKVTDHKSITILKVSLLSTCKYALCGTNNRQNH